MSIFYLRVALLFHTIIFTLVSIVFLSIYFMLNVLPTSIRTPELYPVADVCDLLRGPLPFQQQQEQQRCKKRTCLNVIPDAYIGKWRKRNKLTKEDIEYRKKMDVEIRLKMKVQFPASLVRNDSRCGKKFPIPGFQIQGACDPEGISPCCNHVAGYCGNTNDHCKCSDCTDFREYLSAELSEWIPDQICCNVKNFTQEMACDLLNTHNISIAFIGDSVIRQLSRTMFLLLSGNTYSGAMPVKAIKKDREFCYGDHQIAIKKCNLEVVAHRIDELTPNSICGGKINFHLDLVENYKKYLPDTDMKQIRQYLGRNNSFVVLAVGLHYRLDVEKVIDVYIKRVLDVIESEGNGWPKVIWMGIHAVPNFLLMEPLFHNEGILKFNKQIHEYLRRRDVAVIDTFDMSKRLLSYDGLHYGLGLNFLKVNMILNYLEEQYERCPLP